MQSLSLHGKTIVCVFAHPDDESFGPGGTIATLAKDNQVFILCATKGDAGQNQSGKKLDDMGRVRSAELVQSAKLLGVKQTYFLNYQDGSLCSNLYHNVAADCQLILDRLRPGVLLTFDLLGLSGHIDHISMALISSYLFEKLDYVRQICYYRYTEEQMKVIKEVRPHYFIYRPGGYPKSQIDAELDVEEAWPIRKKAIESHVSQLDDMEKIIKIFTKLPKKEYFAITQK